MAGYGEMPAACQDPAKRREMLIAAGYPMPDVGTGWTDESGKDSSENVAISFALLEFAAANGFTAEEIKSEDPVVQARLCDALEKASGGTPANGNGMSTGTKIAIVAGGVTAVGVIAYLVFK